MALGLRMRVTWDGDIVQDQVFTGWSTVEVGPAGRARVVTPASTAGNVTFRRHLGGWSIRVPGGAAEEIHLPGEAAPTDGAADLLRRLDLGSGRLRCGAATIDFEVLRLARERPSFRLTVALALLGCLTWLGTSGYELTRDWRSGVLRRGGALAAIGDREARFLRVSVDGRAHQSPRLATGDGHEIDGVPRWLLERPRKKPALPATAPKAVVASHKGVTKLVRPLPGAGPAPATTVAGSTSKEETPGELIEKGQQAFLAAELRASIDALSSAEKVAPLDYDNLNWLGLAHFFLGENDPAEARWKQAMALDASRPDAINNLGGVARRRGQTDTEIAMYEMALRLSPGDCHALNSLALARAKQGSFAEAHRVLAESDAACGGDYAYTFIQRAGILGLEGKTAEAMGELEKGLGKVDTLVAIKEYEVEADLLLDPAFASLRMSPRFADLTEKHLPRAVQSKDLILQAIASAVAVPDLDDELPQIDDVPEGELDEAPGDVEN